MLCILESLFAGKCFCRSYIYTHSRAKYNTSISNHFRPKGWRVFLGCCWLHDGPDLHQKLQIFGTFSAPTNRTVLKNSNRVGRPKALHTKKRKRYLKPGNKNDGQKIWLQLLVLSVVTLQGTNISHKNGNLKMIFLFPRWDMLIPWRVVFFFFLGGGGKRRICQEMNFPNMQFFMAGQPTPP